MESSEQAGNRSEASLLAKSRGGDDEAFRQLVEPYRSELRLHCYRMLGSLDDAEDALQDSLLSAWMALSNFEGRSSIRTWLYRVTTSRCLDALRASKRRAPKEWDVPHIKPPAPSRIGDVAWLEPYPDALFKGADPAPGPEARYEQSEAVSLAFITALQILPARQRAVLILRDVLGYHASEVAALLDFSLDAVNSLLKRARATVHERADRSSATVGSAEERNVADAFTRAIESGNVEALVALLTDDVKLAMPPIPFEYVGIEAVANFYRVLMARGPRYLLRETRANGQLAFGAYLRSPDSVLLPANSLAVLTLRGSRISAITRFEAAVLPWFGLPPEVHT